MTDPLLPVILSLESSARSIDETFATAGGRLGEALSVFEATDRRLGTVSAELAASSGMDRVREAMLAVAGDLRTFSGGLSFEANRLNAVVEQGKLAWRSFKQLEKRIGFVSAIARCARIESAWLQSDKEGPGFFGSIGGLVDLAKQSVQDCVEAHARLNALLTAAIASQTEFAATYESRLAQLADNLERSLGRIDDSQRHGTRLAANAALQSRGIADSISAAIIALQCGDSTRQRLEHALATLRIARAVVAGECNFASGLAENDRAVLLRVLHSVIDVQLRDAAATLCLDIEEIDTALRLLSDGMTACQGFGQSPDGNGQELHSPLAAFEADLASASDLLGKCNTAREQVDRVTDALTAFVQQFRETTQSLSRTVSDIVLLGMNARLHASRVGTEGRALVAIAQELKSVADETAEDAAQLLPTFTRMYELVTAMQGRKAGGSDRLVLVDGTMRQLLRAIKEKRADLFVTLEQLARESSIYAGKIGDARTAFAAAGSAAGAIDGAAGVVNGCLAGLPPIHDPTDIAALEAFLDDEVFTLYTMAIERRLHNAALADHGLHSALPESAEQPVDDDLAAVFAF